MNQTNFREKPVLSGEKVLLRPFEAGDAEKLLSILEEIDVRRLTGSAGSDEEASRPMTEEEKERTRAWYAKLNAQTDRLDLAIVDRESGELIGEAVFNEYDEEAGNVNFRILIGASGQGQGRGTEAIRLFLRHGFENVGLHRIGLEVFSFNPRAERVYVKNGFVLEGVKREDFIYNGEYIDSKVYGMLKSDYERVQAERT
ncbi:GNAT family N-acetyltransferase [Saccharibacillus sp. O23]|uniref:GNAT family N-acetyltransferase n=1 Tax=Saccharibacillus sp. O23 TaxID=2009338 RepID=UPI000B4E190F|nr:GNAT family protein [Saccharibacillus sp. O23]OWR32440.1 GNAT family N-acetyltransferase [Saccharibacillus sp. O23]